MAPAFARCWRPTRRRRKKKLGRRGRGPSAGTSLGYLELMKRIHGGEIGELVGGRCYWNQGIPVGQSKASKSWSDPAVTRCATGTNFTWLCGRPHRRAGTVHNLDVINWGFPDSHPGQVCRHGRPEPDQPRLRPISSTSSPSTFVYPNNVHVLSMCRQINNCASRIGEDLVGHQGGPARPTSTRSTANPILTKGPGSAGDRSLCPGAHRS